MEEAILIEKNPGVADDDIRKTVIAYRKMLIGSGALKVADEPERPFQLRNGTRSLAYIDHGDLLCQPATNTVLVEAVGQYVANAFNPNDVILANVDSKASPQLTGAIAATRRYRQIVVLPDLTYRQEKGMNLALRAPADIGAHDKIVIIDDVHTPRDVTALRVAELIRRTLGARLGEEAIGRVEMHLVVGVARDPAAIRSELAGHGIESHWLTTLPDVLTEAWPTLDDPQREALIKEFPIGPDDHRFGASRARTLSREAVRMK